MLSPRAFDVLATTLREVSPQELHESALRELRSFFGCANGDELLGNHTSYMKSRSMRGKVFFRLLKEKMTRALHYDSVFR